MIHYAVAFALLLHVLFWGAGLAVLAMPRRWRRFWPVLVAPAGLALQSLVVWAGAYANLPGTNAYAWWSEAVPAALLWLAVRRHGVGELTGNARRFAGILLVSAAGLALLVLPLARAAKGLTTISLGSCDAADYAGGARMLMEFARSERGGFLGLTEVVRVMSTDNFADYWLRLNHFGPAAIIALNGSVLHCAPHELTSLVTMLLLATSVPAVFWTARAMLRHRTGTSVAVAALFALSPIAWYAVAHVAMGQLVAAQAIALLTWAGVAAWRRRESESPSERERETGGGKAVSPLSRSLARSLRWSGVLAIGYALVLESYAFILVVALVPAVAFAGGLALWRGEWKRFARWLLVMLAPLAVCAVIFWGRVAGLVERFRLLQSFDFGWRIPVLTPEGWLGLVRGTDLGGWPAAFRWIASAVIVGLVVLTLVQRHRRCSGLRASGAWLAASLTLPVLAGYAFLEWRGARLGTNASYDAYKLFFVFLPVMLPVFCAWAWLRMGRVVMIVVLAGSAVAIMTFMRDLRDRPLVVDGELRQLRRIEAMADVKSVNVLLPDMWSRLWANVFLLRTPQYFLTDTYEARWHTPLRGEWDLVGGIIAVKPPGEARRQLTPHYALVDTRRPQFLRAEFGEGWHAEEREAGTGTIWRWTSGDATLRIENPRPHALTVVCTIDGWSFGERDLTLVGAAGAASAAQHVSKERTKTRFTPITVPPGTTTITIRSAQPATVPPGDGRAVGLCVFGLELAVPAH